MPITERSIPQYAQNIVWRNYLKGIVVDPEIALNTTASFIFLQVNGKNTVASISENLSQQYDITYQEAYEDVVMIVDRLVEENILLLDTV